MDSTPETTGQRIVREVPDNLRCTATVYTKDTYRYTGRTRSGFEMHYNKRRCGRRFVHCCDLKLCKQHHLYKDCEGCRG